MSTPMHPVGVLLIHGFGGSIDEVAPLAAFLNARGIHTHCITLDGHAGSREALGRCSVGQWIATAQQGYDHLAPFCSQVFIVGFSMGGLLAIQLALRNPVLGIATLNTPITYWNVPQILSNIVTDLQQGESTHIRHYIHSGCKFPINALIQFKRLLGRTKTQLGALQCPVFIAQGLQDDTTAPKSARYIHRQLASILKPLHWYPDSGHLICHSPNAPQLFCDVLQFIQSL